MNNKRRNTRKGKKAKVSFDGGPCGLKTTILEEIEQQSSIILPGVKLIFVEEAARKFFSLNPDHHQLSQFEKQVQIFKTQLELEETAEEKADHFANQGEFVAVLYDRTLRTNLGYMDPDDYNDLVSSFGLTHSDIEERYHEKIHLVSVAVDRPELYVQDKERWESVEQAKQRDLFLQTIWPYDQFHYNHGSKEDKIQRVLEDFKNKVDKILIYH